MVANGKRYKVYDYFMTLKELDIVRLCLVIADSDDLKSGFRESGIKFESSEKYLLIKSCQDILQSYGVLGKSDEV